jgi:hypothetical protein
MLNLYNIVRRKNTLHILHVVRRAKALWAKKKLTLTAKSSSHAWSAVAVRCAVTVVGGSDDSGRRTPSAHMCNWECARERGEVTDEKIKSGIWSWPTARFIFSFLAWPPTG